MEESTIFWGDNVVIRNVTVVNAARSLDGIANFPESAAPRDVWLRDGLIVSGGKDDQEGLLEVDGTGLFLVPGLIDLQLNDMEHLDKTHRVKMAPGEHVARFHTIATAMLREGVTSFVLASLAMPWESLLEYLSALDTFRRSEYEGEFSGCAGRRHTFEEQLLGAMVEGTFMNKKFRGCHNEAYVLEVKDDWRAKVDAIVATGSVFAVNIAPETNPLACLEMIREVRQKHGKIVAVGHCQPTAAQLRAAIDAGVEYVIHLGNGHTGTSYKKFHKGGMLEECLRNDAMHVTLIADGFHVSKHYIRDWVQRKELHRVSFVSDRAFAVECPREFEVFGISGRREDTPKGTFLRVFNPGDPPLADLLSPTSTAKFSLFGSHCSMLNIFENALNWFSSPMDGVSVRSHPALDLRAAMSVAVALCCANPARVARIDRYVGEIAVGKVANCVLMSVDNKKKVQIRKVFVGKRKQE